MKAKGRIDPSVDIEELKGKAIEVFVKGTEKARAEAEGSAPDVENKKFRCIEAYMKYPIVKEKEREQCVFLVVIEPVEYYLSGKALHHVSRIGRRPWIIRPFIRRPGRVYGKGVPELARHLHKAIDAQQNQRIDAGNKVIGGGGFYRPASGTNPRRLRVPPSTWIPVDNPKEDVYSPPVNMSGITWSSQEQRFLIELLEKLTYLTPAMLGQELASRPTARGTLAVLQQGQAKFNLIARRVQNIICDILTDIRQKYEEHMPPWKWERIVGAKRIRDWPSPEYMAGMYEAKMQLDLTTMDMRTKRELASLMYQVMAFDPLVMQNPAFMWEVRADYLKAFNKEPVEKYIGPRPPTATTQDADDIFVKIEQEEKPDLSRVNVAVVLPALMELKRTERYENFTPEAKVLFNECIREMQLNYIDNVRKAMEVAYAGQKPGLFGGAYQTSGLRNPTAPNAGTMGVGAGLNQTVRGPQG